MGKLAGVTFLALLGLAAAACSGAGKDGQPSTAPECAVKVERFKELSLVDDAIVGDARSLNVTPGPWSFRYAIEAMAPRDVDPGKFVMTWLEDWGSRKTVNNVPLDREPRDEQMNARVICPWLKRTASNACDANCSACTARHLDLSVAPFRLRAIVNRLDLREAPDKTGPSGEGRLVFAFTDGPADDPASKPLAMSVIFEYALPESYSTKEWANAWHALGTHATFNDAYRSDLEAITNRFVARNASPSRMNGSAISQVRSNESLLNWIWQLREFGLDPNGQLLLSTLKNTPAESFNGSPELVKLIQNNADKVKAKKFVVPAYLLGGSIDSFLSRWNLPGVDEATRTAFAKNTCNGCHSENPMVDTAFHVSPFRSGVEKLSPFVNDPQKPATDELATREASLSRAICAP